MRERGRLLAVGIAAALCGTALPPRAVAAEPERRPRNVLAIHAFEPGLPVNAAFTAGLRDALPLGPDLAFFSEHLDRLHFPDPAYEDGFRAWLRTKYARTPPDVVVAVGSDALAFVADPARTPFPGVPVVFGLAPEGTVDRAALPGDVTGVSDRIAIRETVALARRLLPELGTLALVGGASAQDRPLTALLSREARAAAGGLEVVELFGLSMADTEGRLRALPPRSAVLVLSFLEDGAGRKWTGPQALPVIARAAPGPVFTFFTHLMGAGTIGGVQTDFGDTGRAVAGLVARVLAGERPGAIPVAGGASHALLDARQLARWRVPEARVPAGVEVRFREPTAWDRYRWTIVLAVIGFGLQSALVALLLYERRQRWRAEARARENLVILSRMNRVSAMGELVGSLAHEINSPLGAALNNAEAAQRLLRAPGHDPAELRSCLDDIVLDVTRAGEVLRRIRRALTKESGTPVVLDVEPVIRDACRLVKAEARDRGVEVEVEIGPGLPRISGDPVQLSQVLVNLLINALDAVRGVPDGRRRVSVTAVRAGDGVAIRVADSGPGVPPELATRVFEPFYTTKPTGLGMGLPITRSIVEAHGGTVAVTQRAGGGAAFEVLLPAAHGTAAAAGASATG